MIDEQELKQLLDEYDKPREELRGKSYHEERRDLFNTQFKPLKTLLEKERLSSLSIEDAMKIYNEMSVGGPKLHSRSYRENGIERIRKSLIYLLYGDDSLENRFYNFADNPNSEFRLNGVSKAFASTALCLIIPNEYAIWNNAVDHGLKILGIYPGRERGENKGKTYTKISNVLKNFTQKYNLENLFFTDGFIQLIAHGKIGRKYVFTTNLTPKLILDTINIAQFIIEKEMAGQPISRHPEKKAEYQLIHQKIEEFKDKYGGTPNIILKNYLDSYVELRDISDYFITDDKHFYTQKVNSFTWACICPKFDYQKRKYKAHSFTSQYPQLYIGISQDGIEFGFDYGAHVDNDDHQVQSIKSQNDLLKEIFEQVQLKKGLEFYANIKSRNGDTLNKLEVHSIAELKDAWSKDIRILQMFDKNNIPIDLDELINSSFDVLLDVFIYTSLINEWTPQKINEYIKLKKSTKGSTNLEFFILQTGSEQYQDILGKEYHFSKGIPGSKQLKDAENRAKFVYYRDGKLFGLGEIGNIQSRIIGNEDHYFAIIKNYKDIGPIEFNSIKKSVGLDSIGQAGIRNISKEKFDIIIDRFASKPFYLNFKEIKTNLTIDDEFLNRVCNNLNLGDHIIITGPVGTGKTSIVEDISNYAQKAGFCDGYILTTATSDWTTFDTIGGYIPTERGTLIFQEGKILEAIRQNKWVIIDEINRADIDKAFGQLFSVLAGQKVELPFKTDGKGIAITITRDTAKSYFDSTTATYFIGTSWRLLATMNVYDMNFLFDMSYAFMRRFALIYLDIPKEYEKLIDELGKDLSMRERIKILTKLSERKLGPAILKQIIEYLKIRGDNEGAFAEAIMSYVLPQLVGLDEDKLNTTWKELGSAFDDKNIPNTMIRPVFTELTGVLLAQLKE